LGSAGTGHPTMSLPIPRPDADQVTIGVAIPIPEVAGNYLQGRRAEFGDPLADKIVTHITLLPPTAIARAAMPAIVLHLARVAHTLRPFDLTLAGSGTFRPVSPVVFVQVAGGEAGCARTQERIRTGPLARELSFPYHPHVTVAQGIEDDALDQALTELADFRLEFKVGGFGLFEHCADGHWRQRRRFPFGWR
jgi:2'-5' RNA ligase